MGAVPEPVRMSEIVVPPTQSPSTAGSCLQVQVADPES